MNFWNKMAAGALALLLTASLALAGCGDTNDHNDYDVQTPDTAPSTDSEPESAARYDFDLSAYVTLGEYKGIEIPAYDVTVTEEDVQNQVLIARSTFATVAEKEGAVAVGDQVVIDFVGYMDGEKFEGGSAENYNLMIGSGSMIDGFEDGLIGAEKGETVTLEIAFPTPYPNNPAFSGLPVRFDVTVKNIFEQILPPYDDAFVSENYKCATVEEFEQKLYDSIAAQKEKNRETYMMQTIWEALADSCAITDYPAEEYTALYQDNLNYYQALAEQKGISLNEYALTLYGMDVSTFYETLKSGIYSRMQEEMILLSIARAEGLTVTDAEYEEGLTKFLAYYGLTSKEQLLQYVTKEQITESLLFEKAYAFLMENAVIVE